VSILLLSFSVPWIQILRPGLEASSKSVPTTERMPRRQHNQPQSIWVKLELKFEIQIAGSVLNL
jgi:hypothetical protein